MFRTSLLAVGAGVLSIFQGVTAIDEIDAVIEYDHGDNLFELLQKNEATIILAYQRSDPNTKNKKKTFRKAAKIDIDASESAGKTVNQWIAINKDLLPDNNDETMLKMYGNIRDVAFYGYMNTPFHYEWELNSKDSTEVNAQKLVAEKNLRIKPLLPTVKCDALADITAGPQATVAYFGDPTQVRTVNGKLLFLPHLHQANLMAFETEQINFVAIPDQKCMRAKGFSARDEDYTLVFYPGQGKAGIERPITYPNKLTFGQATSWINLQYAWDRQVFNKHARVSIQNYQMNSLVLFIDSKSAFKTERYKEIVAMFSDSVQNFIRPQQIPLITFVYPWDKPRFYGDVTYRFEDDIGHLTKEQITFPSLVFVHAESKRFSVYPHSLHSSQATWQAIGYWSVMESARMDMEDVGNKIIEKKVELGQAPGEKQIDKIQPELESLANLHSQIDAILPNLKANFKRALEDAKWGAAIAEAGIENEEDRTAFIEKAELNLKMQLEWMQIDEEIDEEKEAAMSAVVDLITQLEKKLIEDGVDDEVLRYQMIMKSLKDEEERLLAQEPQEPVDDVNDEL